VRLLVEAGADLLQKSSDGRAPLDEVDAGDVETRALVERLARQRVEQHHTQLRALLHSETGPLGHLTD
jgi:hypothetical protein